MNGQAILLISLALQVLAVERNKEDIVIQIRECLLSRVRVDYDRSKISVGSIGFQEKAVILNALTLGDMDTDDLQEYYLREHYEIDYTEGWGAS